jgi:general secretion pathway protein L
VQERAVLKVQMESTFRQAFPNAQVIVDPMLQMQRQVADLRLKAGQTGPDDFLPLLTRFSTALGARGTDALAGLEYRDGRLRARFREAFLDGPAARDGLVSACAQQGLKLQFEGEGAAALAVVSLQS